MKSILLSIVLLILYNNVSAQSGTPICPYFCDTIPITRYEAGMRFYFPAGKALEQLNKPLPRFRFKRNCDSTDKQYSRVNYRDVAGRVFIIDSISDTLIKAYGNGDYRLYQIYLREESCRIYLKYSIEVNLKQLDADFMAKGTLIPETYTIEDAISLDEVALAQKNLTDRMFYLVPNEEKSIDLVVQIVKVLPGKFHAPLLIYYRHSDNTIDSVFTDVCHLNVPSSNSGINFSSFFTCKPPEKIPTITLKMSPQEVEAILGKPLSRARELEAGIDKLTYVYKDKVLLFINGSLSKISLQ